MGSSKQKTETSETRDVLRDPYAVAGQMSQAFQQYQPGFEQMTYDLYKQYLPQYAAAQNAITQQYAPQQAALSEMLAGQAAQRSQEGLTPEEQQMYLNQYKSLVGSQVNAPVGGNFVAGNLLSQNLAAKQWGQQLGSALALQPMTGGSVGYSPASFNVGNIYNPSLYGQTGTATQTQTSTPSGMQMLGSAAGAAAGLMTGLGAIGFGVGGVGSLGGVYGGIGRA